MLAEWKAVSDGYVARFERHFPHSAERVWSMLTDNEKLETWFPELRVQDLREGGVILFDMQNGTFEEMKILRLKPQSVLEYTWGEDRIRFDLEEETGGCRLLLMEKIGAVTEHTPKDLAGWHVCLDMIGALLDGQKGEFRKEAWEMWYEKYKELLSAYRN